MRAVPYETALRILVQQFRRARWSRSSMALSGVGLLGWWIVHNHPRFGHVMRLKVSDALRRDNRAHYTIHVGRDGLLLALADQFVDCDGVMAPIRTRNSRSSRWTI